MSVKSNVKLLVLTAALLLAGCGQTTSSVDPVSSSSKEPISSVVSSSQDPVSSSDTSSSGWSWGSFSWSGWGSSTSRSSGGTSSKAGSSSSKTKTNDFDDNGFNVTTNLNNVNVIHTQAQKTYLEYNGSYETIDPSKYPDGSKMDSDSLPVTIAFNHTPDASKTLKAYTITFGQKADLSDGYEITGTTAKTINVVNPFLGTNYFRLGALYSDNSKGVSPIQTFKVDETCPRNLAIGGMTNCRDMGGRTLKDGGKIKQGLLYRTCGNKFDYSTTITDAGKKEMLEHLGVKTEINVADGTNYNVKLNGTTCLDLKMDYGSGSNPPNSHHLSRNAENVKNFFNTLGDIKNYPIYFHCRIGTDRTGLCAILTNGLLGVDLNEIYQDYLFSNFGKIGEKRYIGSKAGQDNIQNYIKEIQAMNGESFQNKVYNFLLALGVKAETLNNVINILTDGTHAQGNDAGQIVKTADQLTLEGVTVTKDSSQRDNPDNYVKLDASTKTASLTFTASKAFKGQIVAYIGNKEHSTSKKISDALTMKVDGTASSVTSVTFAAANMGNCSNRINYYPVIMNEVQFEAGQHTVTIAGVSSANAMNLGTLCIFGAGK